MITEQFLSSEDMGVTTIIGSDFDTKEDLQLLRIAFVFFISNLLTLNHSQTDGSIRQQRQTLEMYVKYGHRALTCVKHK